MHMRKVLAEFDHHTAQSVMSTIVIRPIHSDGIISPKKQSGGVKGYISFPHVRGKRWAYY